MAPVKILACGDVNGNFLALQKRLNAIVKKSGSFDMLLCVGEFFGEDDDLNRRMIDGQIDLPVHTYVLGPSCPSTSAYYPDEGAEITENVTFLGKHGLLNSPAGLTIAYFSGVEDVERDPVQRRGRARDAAADRGRRRVHRRRRAADERVAGRGRQALDESADSRRRGLEAHLAPRLRPPAQSVQVARTLLAVTLRRNHRIIVEKQRHCTRFIGLAPVENAEKEKWIYAFSMQPLKIMTREELTAQPPNASEFPYMDILEEQVNEEREKMIAKAKAEGGNRNNFFDMEADMEKDNDIGSRKRRKNDWQDEAPMEKKEPAPCWFCLSNVDAEKHLVVSIGNSCYAAMPKGPLTEDHVLILSIEHIQSVVAAPQEVRDEIQKFKNAFTLAADKVGKVLVVFERNYRTQHLQVQIVPVPKTCVKGLRTAFLNKASQAGIEISFISEEDKLTDLVNEGSPYFVAELPDGTRLFTRSMKAFPLQFGREVLASPAVLDCEDLIDWRQCELGKDKETELTKALQARFKPFDFTEDEDSD